MARRPNMPNPENCSLQELETAAGAAVSKRSHNRMMAIKALFLGLPYHQVATLYGVAARTLSRWVKRFNDSGIDGLVEKGGRGPLPKISPEKSAE